MKDRAEFLKEDLKHLFDDQGIDKSQYNDKVEFRDPITSYNSVKGSFQCLQKPVMNVHLQVQATTPPFSLQALCTCCSASDGTPQVTCLHAHLILHSSTRAPGSSRCT